MEKVYIEDGGTKAGKSGGDCDTMQTRHDVDVGAAALYVLLARCCFSAASRFVGKRVEHWEH